MSSDQVYESVMVERTRQQIRALVAEIAHLAQQDIQTRDFYRELLQRLLQALGAPCGAVWQPGEGGSIELVYQINLHETRLVENPEAMQRHGRLLQRALVTGEAAIVPPHMGDGQEGQPGNPTDFLLLLGPVRVKDETRGLVEVFQRPDTAPTSHPGYLRFVRQMCELAAEYHKNRQLQHYSLRQALWNQLEHFARVAHYSLDVRDTAYTIANEGRRLIECDRVSVAVRRGRRYVIEAISGQDTFDKRSNTVRLLTRLAQAVAVAGEPLWFTGDAANLAPQVEEAAQAFVDETHTKCVAVLPLRRPPQPPKDKEQDHLDEQPGEVIGALVVEQIEDARPREGMAQRVAVVCDHGSTALANALDHQGLFLMPVWRALSKSRVLVTARNLPKTLAAAAALVVLVLVLVLVPYDFQLRGKGVLLPVERRDVFAAVDGTVEQVLVRHGERVRRGQKLLVLRNSDVEGQIEHTLGEIRKTESDLAGIQRQLFGVGGVPLRREDEVKLASDEASLKKKLESLQQQLRIYQEKQRRLTIRSPIDGVVATWDVDRLLQYRAVKAGAILLHLANPDGEWEVELHMPEDRMGHIAQAQRALGQDLPVTYYLAMDPATRHQGRIAEVHQSAEVRGEEGNTVLVRVKIDQSRLRNIRPGAGVTGKVYCGRRALGYVLFHDLVAWLQREVAFRLW
jgi:multidrug efflux pump subunit AcrA (membrane-fusion protein)